MATRPIRRQHESGLFIKHLKGEYSLARSYWLHTVLLGWGLSALAAYIFHRIGEGHAARHVSMAVLVFQPLATLVWLWSTLGTWVAAMKHLFIKGSRLWAVLVMMTLLVGVFGVMRELSTMRPYLQEHWEVAQGKQPTDDGFTVSLQDNGRVVEFKGGVNEGAAAALDKAIADAPKVSTVRLDSPGGWLREGERMAAVVRRYQLHTHVDEDCYSSCTLVFLAGKDRTAGQHAAVGFHRGRGIGEGKRGGSATSDEAELYAKTGLDAAFVRRILNTPNDEVWVPTRRELLKAHVLTR